MPQNPQTPLTDPDVWLAQKQQGQTPTVQAPPSTGAQPLEDPDQWMAKHQGDPMLALSKAKTIGAPKRTWYEEAIPGITSIPGAIVGGKYGGAPGSMAGSYLGGAAGDLLVSGPLSSYRRGVWDPMSDRLHEANKAGESAAIGDVVGQGFSAAAKKVLAPFANSLTVQGMDVLKRFRTPTAESATTSVLPSDVTDSRISTWLERTGRAGMFSGGDYAAADEAAKAATRKSMNQNLATMGARAIPESPTIAAQEARQLGTTAAQDLQTTIKGNRAATEARGQQLYNKLFKQADSAGFGIPQSDFAGNPTTPQSLQSAHAELSDLKASVRILKKQSETNEEARKLLRAATQRMAEKQDEVNKALTSNPQIQQAYDEANNFWKAGKQKFGTPLIKGIERGNPDQLADQLISGRGLKDTRVQGPGAQPMMSAEEKVRAVRRAGPQAVPHIREAVIRKLIADHTDPKTGWISGNELLETLGENAATLKAVMPAEFAGWRQMATALAYKQRKREDIGRVFMQLRQPSAAVETVSGNIRPFNTAILAVPSILSKVMTSNKALDWLTTGIQTGWKTEAGAQALKQLGSFLSRETMDTQDDAEERQKLGLDIPMVPEIPAEWQK